MPGLRACGAVVRWCIRRFLGRRSRHDETDQTDETQEACVRTCVHAANFGVDYGFPDPDAGWISGRRMDEWTNG